MGLETGVKPDEIEIYVDGELSPDEEEYLERRIEAIAMRAPRFSVRNYLESERESARTQRGVALVMLGVAVVFCATAVGIIAGGVTRRVRADRRMIGTIRAVGADRKTVRRCYMGQIILSVGAGAILGGAAYVAVILAAAIVWGFNWLAPLAMLMFTAVCFLGCRGMLNLSLRDTLSHSIVENIREL